ncbi:ataxin-10 isoform X1 [Homo sapiens]|uniref:ataxin-10 isoform X1 n=1 Tax=Homo sapiens TaxID=9606 RepID=UPI0023DF35B4|nr:ataxin-10 isoform X1 [Homo sapiens]
MAAPRPPPARLSGVMVPAPIQDLEALRALTALFKEQRNRETAPRTIFQRVLDILKKSSHAVELACRDPSQVENLASSLQLITECFRCLRNACIECSVNQNSIRNLDTIGVAVDLILLFRELRVEQESLLTAFRCGLQFLGNIASRNEDSQSIVWVHAFPELFLSCLNHPDKKIVAYSSMILFTSLNHERMKELEENLNIAIDVIDAYQKHPESEWPFLIITDLFLKSPELVQAMFPKLNNQERVTLLDLMIAKITSDEPLTKDDIPVFLRHAELIASTFVDQCKTVLKLASEEPPDDEEALATIRLLDVLCEMTVNTELLGYLQVFPGLLERVIDLLRVIHVAGKETTNIFSNCGCVRAEGDISNVANGFKSHLIRLIGNLCYKNKDNQDKVNELDGIPLILDNCNISDSNPCILACELPCTSLQPGPLAKQVPCLMFIHATIQSTLASLLALNFGSDFLTHLSVSAPAGSSIPQAHLRFCFREGSQFLREGSRPSTSLLVLLLGLVILMLHTQRSVSFLSSPS